MRKFRLWPAVAVLGSIGVAQGAESMSGRWAEDEAACAAFGTAKSPLVVSDTSLRWRDETCRTGRQYRTGDTLHVEAFCHGDTGERTIPVSLRLAGDRIVVSWARVLQGQLQRCR
ncbi:MAG TPA: hypothetical protein VEJ40_05845 [Pseudolabrys sp.]|nr:hypothetical protein [Pseudolabrys sp.]